MLAPHTHGEANPVPNGKLLIFWVLGVGNHHVGWPDSVNRWWKSASSLPAREHAGQRAICFIVL